MVTFDTGRPGHVIAFELKLADGKLKGTAKDEFLIRTTRSPWICSARSSLGQTLV